MAAAIGSPPRNLVRQWRAGAVPSPVLPPAFGFRRSARAPPAHSWRASPATTRCRYGSRTPLAPLTVGVAKVARGLPGPAPAFHDESATYRYGQCAIGAAISAVCRRKGRRGMLGPSPWRRVDMCGSWTRPNAQRAKNKARRKTTIRECRSVPARPVPCPCRGGGGSCIIFIDIFFSYVMVHTGPPRHPRASIPLTSSRPRWALRSLSQVGRGGGTSHTRYARYSHLQPPDRLQPCDKGICADHGCGRWRLSSPPPRGAER